MGHSYRHTLTSRVNHYDGRHIHSSCKLFIINSIILSSYIYSSEMIEGVLVNTRDNKRTVILINILGECLYRFIPFAQSLPFSFGIK